MTRRYITSSYTKTPNAFGTLLSLICAVIMGIVFLAYEILVSILFTTFIIVVGILLLFCLCG